MIESDLWVFGYGSLMWRPGFDYTEIRPAILHGYRRAFCIYSHHYRGTPDRPGLVLGLKTGGLCRGLAFRVPQERAEEVIGYLDERELVSYAYKNVFMPITFDDGRLVDAYTFIADPMHRQYAGDLGIDLSAQLIMEASGSAGLNRDYLINTVRELESHGFAEPELHALCAKISEMTGLIEQGSGI